MKTYTNRKRKKIGFGHAVDGLRHTLAHERNFKIHIGCAFAAVSAAILLRLDALHSFMVVYACFAVLTLELVNTAIEAVTNLACGGKPHPLAKTAKDCAAAATLLASVQALIIAGFVVQHVVSRFI